MTAIAFVAAVTIVLSACDWATFRHDPAHTGYNASETAVGVANVSTLTQTWRATTGGSIVSSPAVVNGVVYVGSADGDLHAYSADGSANCAGSPKTCTELWTADTGDLDSSPAVANGIVYVNSESRKLMAFDAAGSANCSGSPKTCLPLWTAYLAMSSEGGSLSSPVVAGGMVYVGDEDNNLNAYDAAGIADCSGDPTVCQPLWRANFGGVVESSPAVANGVVYVTSEDGNLYALAAEGNTNCVNGTACPLWSASAPGGISSPAVSGGVVYIGTGNHKLVAFDAAGSTNCSGAPKKCTPLWSAVTGKSIYSSPAIANGTVYVGSFDRKLYAFDAAGSTNCSGSPGSAKSCTPLWTATTGGEIESSPAVANGVVYVGSDDGSVYAYDAAGATNCTAGDCSPLWSVSTTGPIASSPAVANGRVYFGSGNTNIYAYALP